MKLNILREDKNSIEIKVGGEGHTLLNLLQSSLQSYKTVSMAGYAKPHPLMDHAILYLKTKRNRNQKKVLIDATGNAKKRMEEFLTKFNDQVAKS